VLVGDPDSDRVDTGVWSAAPRQNIAMTMITKTASCCTPGIGAPWSVGNQLWVEA